MILYTKGPRWIEWPKTIGEWLLFLYVYGGPVAGAIWMLCHPMGEL